MKITGFTAFYLAGLMQIVMASNTLHEISELSWDNRIIILNQPSNVDQVLIVFAQKKAEIDERHIVWFVVDKNKVRSNYPGSLSENFTSQLQSTFSLTSREVLLIGKDGDIKLREPIIQLERLFSTIDAMPMRQQEMRMSEQPLN